MNELYLELNKIELTPINGSKYCEFSVVENKLKTLYQNQENILRDIKLISQIINTPNNEF